MAERLQLDEPQCAAAIKRAQRYLFIMRKLQQTEVFFFFLLDQIIRSLHYKESAQQGQEVRSAQSHWGQWLGWYAVVHKVFFTGPVSFI